MSGLEVEGFAQGVRLQRSQFPISVRGDRCTPDRHETLEDLRGYRIAVSVRIVALKVTLLSL